MAGENDNNDAPDGPEGADAQADADFDAGWAEAAGEEADGDGKDGEGDDKGTGKDGGDGADKDGADANADGDDADGTDGDGDGAGGDGDGDGTGDGDGQDGSDDDPSQGNEGDDAPPTLEALAAQVAKNDRDVRAMLGRILAAQQGRGGQRNDRGNDDGAGADDAAGTGDDAEVEALDVETVFKDQLAKLREYDPEVAESVTAMFKDMAGHFTKQISGARSAARQAGENATLEQQRNADIAVLNEVMPQEEWAQILQMAEDGSFIDRDFAEYVESMPLSEARKLWGNNPAEVASILGSYKKSKAKPSGDADADGLNGNENGNGKDTAAQARKRARQRSAAHVQNKGGQPDRGGDDDSFDGGWNAAGHAAQTRGRDTRPKPWLTH